MVLCVVLGVLRLKLPVFFDFYLKRFIFMLRSKFDAPLHCGLKRSYDGESVDAEMF